MDQTSMTLGWLIGRQLAGQRKVTNAQILEMSYLSMEVIAEEATLRLDADGYNYGLFPDSGYSSQFTHQINILTSLYNDGHLIITTDTGYDSV